MSTMTKSAALSRSQAVDLLYHEAWALDERRFDDWLAMFTEDVRFWMPAWKDETTPTSDPEKELSLVYYEGRAHLADRIWRLGSGLSNASEIPARVTHMIGNVLIDSADECEAHVRACFTAHHYDARSGRSHVFFGHYRHLFRRDGERWLIAAKTITLMNDCIPTVADLYMI
jgi:3-phenylpropionate/cinnamic acid dioxygenase small subunit